MSTAFLSIFLVGLVGGAIPLVRRWSDRWHHAALAFSAGVFLGAVFLHLLPSVAAGGGVHAHGPVESASIPASPGGPALAETTRTDDAQRAAVIEAWSDADRLAHDHDGDGVPDHDADAHVDGHAGHGHGPIGPWLWVLVGVLGVFLVEALLIPGATHGHGHHHDDAGRHRAVGYAALVGLTVHALTAGVALAAVDTQTDLAGVMLLAILAHKGFESFSLASVFGLSGLSRPKIVVLVVLFSLVTPLGLLLGERLVDLVGPSGVGVMTALATGTFLYVCLCELLPEVFHRREDGPWKIALLGLGIGAMWAAHALGGA